VKIVIGIEVKSTELREVSGVAKRTGKAYCFYEQTGWVDLGKPYPSEIRWVCPDVKRADSKTGEITTVPQATQAGRYVLDESCVYVDRNGALQINVKGMKPALASAPAIGKAV
jgi:hypothetical protein